MEPPEAFGLASLEQAESRSLELEYWKAREGVVSAQLADAQQELNKAIAAQQVFE